MMLMMDPPKHTKLRLLVNKGFTPRMIGRLDERIRETTKGIVDEVDRAAASATSSSTSRPSCRSR